MEVSYIGIFTPIEDGQKWIVEFPDLDNRSTQGDSIKDAMEMGKDLIANILYRIEDKSKFPPYTIPTLSTEQIKAGQIPMMISFDYDQYVAKYFNQSVRRTVSLPKWLDKLAVEENLSLSKVLQDALREKLDLNKK